MDKNRTIVLALDGLSEKIIDTAGGELAKVFRTHFHTKTVDADLLDRGWPEWITGRSGREIRALYNKPLADGSWSFSASYGLQDYASQNITTLWEKLNSAGKTVGLFGMPTTYPAPELEGFCVSGSGAGFDQSEGMPQDAFFPPDLKDTVSELGGLLPELRFANGDFKSIAKYLEKEREGFERRISLFIKLAEIKNTDVTVFFDKYFAHFAWLLMRGLEELKNQDSAVQKAILFHLDFAAQCIGTVLEAFPDSTFVVVSDHGAQGRKGSINLNSLLSNANLLSKATSFDRSKLYLRRKIKYLLPKKFQGAAAKLAPRLKIGRRVPGEGIYSSRESKCFAARYIPGVFINTVAFGGHLHGHKIDECFKEIQDLVNSNPDLDSIGLKVLGSAAIKFFEPANDEPPIWFVPVTEPKGFFFESDGPLLHWNKFEINEKLLAPKASSMIGGIKDRDAIFGVSKSEAHFLDGKHISKIRHTHEITLDIICGG